MSATYRPIKRIINAQSLLEGGGFPVRRPFPTAACMQVDPFLLFDHLGPITWGPGEGIGAPEHPHRGFETVTYLLSGEMQHKDSGGHTGNLTPGDVQWMTAGGGVVHSELPSDKFMREGGTLHGLQIWVNLPAKDKMMSPRYQEVPAAQIPEAHSADGLVNVRIIAGHCLGKYAVIDTRIPIIYLHFSIQPGGSISQPVPAGHNALIYIIQGELALGETATRLSEGQMAEFDADSDNDSNILFNVATDGKRTDAIMLAGRPLNEPVTRHGPFVMNTEEEIRTAIRDYQAGRMGTLP